MGERSSSPSVASESSEASDAIASHIQLNEQHRDLPHKQLNTKSNAQSNKKLNKNLGKQINVDVSRVHRPQLAAYTNYREFLRDFLDFRRYQTRTQRRPYCYATFAAAADIRSPNYLKLVIDGDRNLSDKMAEKFAKAMDLAATAVREFCLMVRFNQETDSLLRAQRLQELNELRVAGQVKCGELKEEVWQEVPDWVTWVVAAMADLQDVPFTTKKLHQELLSEVQLSLVEQARKKLIEQGRVRIQEGTGFAQTVPEGAHETAQRPLELIRKVKAELIYLGLESLFREAQEDREFGAATLALTEDEFMQLRFELRQLRKRWQREVAAKRSVSKADRIYQVNIQLFPITKARTTAGSKKNVGC